MTNELHEAAGAAPSIIHGIPLSEEAGIGALTLSGYLREVTARYADNEALVMHEGGHVERWSYAELWARSMAVARSLLALGMGKGSRVGVLMTNRPEWLSATFGAALAGCTAVGFSTFSTPDEMDHLLRISGVSVLLLERKVLKKDFAAVLRDLAPEIGTAEPGRVVSLTYPFLRYLAMVGPDEGEGAIESWAAFIARGRDVPDALVEAAAATNMPADPGLLLFSSGSTSKPKGIINGHRGVCLQLWRWVRIYDIAGWGTPVRCWSANGFFWSGNFSQALGGAFSTGGSLILQSVFNAEEALWLMQEEKATMAIAWPHQWKQLADAPGFAEAQLGTLVYVGSHTPLGQHPTVRSTWPEPLAAYGNTETFTISSIFPSGTPPETVNRSSGAPQPGNIFKIVDPLTGGIVPMGERGEIAVKGPTLMLGYVGVPLDETVDEQGFFRTGDGGYVDAEGRLYWEGRLNDIIKTGGANVSPLEIDEVLLRMPGVKISQTVGVADDLLGELVVACLVPNDGATLDAGAVQAWAKERLASYKVPRRVLFFRQEEFAQTGSNKIKSADLRKLAAERLKA